MSDERGTESKADTGSKASTENETGGLMAVPARNQGAGDVASFKHETGAADKLATLDENAPIDTKPKTRRRKGPVDAMPINHGPIKRGPIKRGPITATPIIRAPIVGTCARTSAGHRHVRRLRGDASWSDPARRALFLEHLAATCNVTASAQAAGLIPAGAYKLRARDAEFEAQWYGAREQARDHLWLLLHQHAAAQLEPPADRARRLASLGSDPDAHEESTVEASVIASVTGDAAGEQGGGPHKVDPSWAMALLKLHKDEETRAEGRRKDGRRPARHVPLSADALRVLIFEKLSLRNKELGGDG